MWQETTLERAGPLVFVVNLPRTEVLLELLYVLPESEGRWSPLLLELCALLRNFDQKAAVDAFDLETVT